MIAGRHVQVAPQIGPIRAGIEPCAGGRRRHAKANVGRNPNPCLTGAAWAEHTHQIAATDNPSRRVLKVLSMLTKRPPGSSASVYSSWPWCLAVAWSQMRCPGGPPCHVGGQPLIMRPPHWISSAVIVAKSFNDVGTNTDPARRQVHRGGVRIGPHGGGYGCGHAQCVWIGIEWLNPNEATPVGSSRKLRPQWLLATFDRLFIPPRRPHPDLSALCT